MALETLFAVLGDEACDCCVTDTTDQDGVGEGYGCKERKTVFTHREEKVLKEIRELSLQAQGIRAQLKQCQAAGSADEELLAELGAKLEGLRRRRSLLESERIAAAEERMRLLGHA